MKCGRLHIGWSQIRKLYGDNGWDYLKHDIGTLTIVLLMTWKGLWLKVCWTYKEKKKFLMLVPRAKKVSQKSFTEAAKISMRIMQLWTQIGVGPSSVILWRGR